MTPCAAVPRAIRPRLRGEAGWPGPANTRGRLAELNLRRRWSLALRRKGVAAAEDRCAAAASSDDHTQKRTPTVRTFLSRRMSYQQRLSGGGDPNLQQRKSALTIKLSISETRAPLMR